MQAHRHHGGEHREPLMASSGPSHPKSMRRLRRRLIDLMEVAREQQHRPPIPTRLAAVIVRGLMRLLQTHPDRSTAATGRLISRGHFHRHIICIRCPDQAFFLDAIKGYCRKKGIQPLEIQTMVVHLSRDPEGRVADIQPPSGHERNLVMFIALHISATLCPDGTALLEDLEAILQAVDLSVQDFHSMRNALKAISEHLEACQKTDEARLLDWMIDDKYLFFGLRMGERGLGLFRSLPTLARVVPGLLQEMASVPKATAPGMDWLHLTSCQGFLYSPTSIEAVRFAWHADEGIAEAFLLGRFARGARYANASRVPLLKRSWRALEATPLLQQSAFYRREIRTLFDRLPKPFLLSVNPEDLLYPLKGIVDLTGPTQTHASCFRPKLGNVSFLLAAIPADRVGPNVIAGIVRRFASLGVQVLDHVGCGIDGHRMFVFTLKGDVLKQEAALAEQLQQGVTFWKDRAREHLIRHANRLDIPEAMKFLAHIPPVYQDLFPPEQVVEDLLAIAWVQKHGKTKVRIQIKKDTAELHVFATSLPPLGQLVSIVQAFALTALEEAVVTFPQCNVSLASIRLLAPRKILAMDLPRITRAIERVLQGLAADDPLNALVITAMLDIEEVRVLIALRNHLFQLHPEASLLNLNHSLQRHPRVANRLYRMFEARHRPSMPEAYLAQSELEFRKALSEVQTISDDRWLRALAELVRASLRTNAYVRSSSEPLAIKIDPSKLSFIPRPVPYREIFVEGVQMQGVHLRAGPVARGGIRHSDRMLDYRTEALELMATQVVKNGLIVPTGAKGCFVTKDGSSPAEQYRRYIRALLSITDNRKGENVVPPQGIRVPPEDRDDPYLVVAADKGTAAFSDIANDEACRAGFWLRDAFASGGKTGYSHKALGITAKGAWVCIAHHFEKLGMDAYSDPLRVVGIGDMSGDVFGNGMLINPNIRLIAAFNHRWIFLDPEPNAKKAFAERRRLFEQGLDWDHYASDAISRGGGVFPRNAKCIELSVEARQVLDIEDKTLSGERLIRAILAAPVDLLFNGGIGTYVKASDESHEQVKDPANNAVRIDACALRCQVVGEGGNLGLTQRARIEYAARGGLINMDAVDNSGGVDLSDHEVNLKILFAFQPEGAMPLEKRNRLLQALCPEVVKQCLNNNLEQARCLSLAEKESRDFIHRFLRLRDILIAQGRIDRRVDPYMHESEGESLKLRPQLAVLMGHEKNRLHEELVHQEFASTSCFSASLLETYFPLRLRRLLPQAIRAHPLAEEIVCTMAANRIIHHFGLGAVHHLETLLDAPLATIAQGLFATDFMLDGDMLRQAIWQQVVPQEKAIAFQRVLQEEEMRFAEDLVRLCKLKGIGLAWLKAQRSAIRRFRNYIAKETSRLVDPIAFSVTVKGAMEAGLEERIALRLASLPEISNTAFAVHVSASTGLPLSRCLKAAHACLHLLPLLEVDARLRTSEWGKGEFHELRKEWLHRLSALRVRAAIQLLRSADHNDYETGKALWSRHRHWQAIQDMRAACSKGELDRLSLLLLLSRLETLIDEND